MLPLLVTKATVILATGALLVSGSLGLVKQRQDQVKYKKPSVAETKSILNYLGKETGKAIGKKTRQGWDTKSGQRKLDGRKPVNQKKK